MAHNTYLDAVKSDYKNMLEHLRIAELNATGFLALAFSSASIEEAYNAYNSETGKAIRRNAYKIYAALDKLKEALEPVED